MVSKIVAKLKTEFNYESINIIDMSHKMLDNIRIIALNLRQAKDKGKNDK